jgi:hypothetical protein
MKFQKVRVRIKVEPGRAVSNGVRGVILEEGFSASDVNEVEGQSALTVSGGLFVKLCLD